MASLHSQIMPRSHNHPESKFFVLVIELLVPNEHTDANHMTVPMVYVEAHHPY